MIIYTPIDIIQFLNSSLKYVSATIHTNWIRHYIGYFLNGNQRQWKDIGFNHLGSFACLDNVNNQSTITFTYHWSKIILFARFKVIAMSKVNNCDSSATSKADMAHYIE